MCNKRAGVFLLSGHKATRRTRVALQPNKTLPASLLNGFQDIPQTACLLGARTKGSNSERKILAYKQAMPYQYTLCIGESLLRSLFTFLLISIRFT